MSYPELDKMLAVSDKSQVIGEFLEWAQSEKQLVIAVWHEEDADGNKLYHPRLLPAQFHAETLLAEYFEIDLAEVERERRKILEGL